MFCIHVETVFINFEETVLPIKKKLWKSKCLVWRTRFGISTNFGQSSNITDQHGNGDRTVANLDLTTKENVTRASFQKQNTTFPLYCGFISK